jgi:hypothetical protein
MDGNANTLRKPAYWEPDEVWEQYWESLKQAESDVPLEPASPLRKAIAKARGEILTEEDMEAAVRFGNRAYATLVESQRRRLSSEVRALLRPCSVCNSPTPLACSDCRIDTEKSIFVCSKSECRDKHELGHEQREGKQENG